MMVLNILQFLLTQIYAESKEQEKIWIKKTETKWWKYLKLLLKIILEMILLTKMTINPDRRQEIKKIVLSALQHVPEPSLPLKIKTICKSFSNIRLIPFSIHMKRHNLSYEEMKSYCGTSDSCADYYTTYNKYIRCWGKSLSIVPWKVHIFCGKYKPKWFTCCIIEIS